MIEFSSAPDEFVDGQLSPADRLSRYFLELRGELLRFLARRAGRARAEDLAHDLWVRLRERGDPDSWVEPRAVIFTAASNLATDDGRREARERARASTDEVGLASVATHLDPSRDAENISRIEQLAHALEELPEICREAFLMNRIDALTHAEIAATLGISKKSVQRYIERALHHLLSTAEE